MLVDNNRNEGRRGLSGKTKLWLASLAMAALPAAAAAPQQPTDRQRQEDAASFNDVRHTVPWFGPWSIYLGPVNAYVDEPDRRRGRQRAIAEGHPRALRAAVAARSHFGEPDFLSCRGWRLREERRPAR